MIGTNMLLTFAMRWMPPNTTSNAKAAVKTPIHNGLTPKACCMALQMVLLWMEL